MALSNILMNWALWVDGVRVVGTGEKCELPAIKRKGEEYQGGGMIAPVDVFFGYEKLEAKFSQSAMDASIMVLPGLSAGIEKPFTFRGSLSTTTGGRIGVRGRMLGVISEVEFDGWEMGKKHENNYSISVRRYTLTQGDTEVYYVDPIAGIFRANGQDQYLDDRNNLGY